jgi:undecaprenyl diphosphate synthase
MAKSIKPSQFSQLKNVAIIMDGNGRWAKSNALQVSKGHEKGVAVVKDIVEESINQSIESLTLYAFSSENWGRPPQEINSIKKLILKAIDEQLPDLIEQEVSLSFFGELDKFGKKILERIDFAQKSTKFKKSNLRLNIALGYGGQQDIVNIVKKTSKDIQNNIISIDEINHDYILKKSLVPESEIDLLIRTGGDNRVSNFLLYQIAYSEIMFTNEYWPDFSKQKYQELINKFKKVSRRFGKRI